MAALHAAADIYEAVFEAAVRKRDATTGTVADWQAYFDTVRDAAIVYRTAYDAATDAYAIAISQGGAKP
jgi:hypothetical protein